MNNGRLFDGTELTGSFVYSSPVHLNDDSVDLLVMYDPDEPATATANVILQVSYDNTETAAASSEWVQVGELASSSGTLTFTARQLNLASTGAGTKKYAHWRETVHGLKFRVGVKESNVSSDFGNITVHFFANKA